MLRLIPTCRDDHDGRLVHVLYIKFGETISKPDSWYTINANGEFIESE
jgi:hypothetical protein